MQILIFHPQELSSPVQEQIRRSFFGFPADQLLIEMVKNYRPFRPSAYRILIPETWQSPDLSTGGVEFFNPSEEWFVRTGDSNGRSHGSAWIFSNAGVLTDLDTGWLQNLISTFAWDVLSVRVDPKLSGSREQVKLTGQQQIVGFRRQYQTSAEPDSPSENWPDHLLCKPEIWRRLRRKGGWSSYSSFQEVCKEMKLNCRWIRAGGRRKELFTPAGQMELLAFSQTCSLTETLDIPGQDPSVRIYGKIHAGRTVRVEPGTVIAAPAILCEGTVVGAHSVLREVFAGPSVQIPPHSRIQRQVLMDSPSMPERISLPVSGRPWAFEKKADSVFRGWPAFSYPCFGKRLFDLLASIFILVLFLPFFPIIALAVKLTSSGPVFYRARRQGLHGREFDCLKFRTMLEQAESMQELLRFASQVDGPQFKIEDDPRISPIGKFLRDTCIDELPQFLNVLAGQMSIVGPRPSPESENEFCPAWRDARLSVRPGITGMWQVCRTRGASMDFQEWIYYDTEYVRRLSFRTDLWICYRTARKLISLFLDQFG